jgi:predicted transposase YdaD
MRFDATVKDLLEESPAAWPDLVGQTARRVEVIDADVSTVTAAADKVLHIRDNPEWIHHLEFQSSPDPTIPRRANVYNAILEERHGLPVRSSIILLRREAHLAVINGVYECRWPHDLQPYRTFRHDVIRVWELPPERFLKGALGVLPFAPISAVTRTDLPEVLQEVKRRLQRDAPPSHVNKLWTAVYVLMGLRYQETVIDTLLKEVIGMEDSVTYQAIIAKGEAKGLKKGAITALQRVLVLLGQDQFGKPAGARVKTTIEKMDDPEELERLTVRVPHVKSWEELLSLPPKSSRKRNG